MTTEPRQKFLIEIADQCGAIDAKNGPKYQQLMKIMRTAISEGHLKAGDRLPTETEFAKSIPLALGTIQKAIKGMVDQGVLYRRRRNGTFVADTAQPLNDMSRFAFERADGNIVKSVLTDVVERKLVPPEKPWSKVLGKSEEGYLRITRIDKIRSAMSCCNEFYLRADRFPELLSRPIKELSGQNLRTMLAQEYNISTAQVSLATRSVYLPSRITKLLNLKAKTPGMELEATAISTAGDALFVQFLYAPLSDIRIRFLNVIE